DCLLKVLRIFALTGRLDAAEGGGGAAEPGISGGGVVVVELSPGKGAGIFPGKIVIEEFFVGILLHMALLQPAVFQSPADVVMAADVVEKYVILRESGHNLRLPL